MFGPAGIDRVFGLDLDRFLIQFLADGGDLAGGDGRGKPLGQFLKLQFGERLGGDNRLEQFLSGRLRYPETERCGRIGDNDRLAGGNLVLGLVAVGVDAGTISRGVDIEQIEIAGPLRADGCVQDVSHPVGPIRPVDLDADVKLRLFVLDVFDRQGPRPRAGQGIAFLGENVGCGAGGDRCGKREAEGAGERPSAV